MANNKNPNKKRPGEKPPGKYHYNPGNMSEKVADIHKDESTRKTTGTRLRAVMGRPTNGPENPLYLRIPEYETRGLDSQSPPHEQGIQGNAKACEGYHGSAHACRRLVPKIAWRRFIDLVRTGK